MQYCVQYVKYSFSTKLLVNGTIAKLSPIENVDAVTSVTALFSRRASSPKNDV